MSRYWLVVAILLGVLVVLGLAPPPATPGSLEPSSTLRVAPSAAPPPPSDTLRSSSPVGTPLLLSLPATLNDVPVTRYTILRGPSLSGVAGQSFTWIPRDIDPGTYDVQLRAHHPNAEPDTLVLRIDIES